MTKLIKLIAKSEVKVDKNGRNYITAKVSNPTRELVKDEVTGEFVLVRNPNPFTTSLNAYEKSYLNEEPQALWEAEVGESFKGEIVQREVQTPYEIIDEKTGEVRMVTLYKTLVFGDTSSAGFESAIKAAFRSKGVPMKGDVLPLALPKAVSQLSLAEKEFQTA